MVKYVSEQHASHSLQRMLLSTNVLTSSIVKIGDWDVTHFLNEFEIESGGELFNAVSSNNSIGTSITIVGRTIGTGHYEGENERRVTGHVVVEDGVKLDSIYTIFGVANSTKLLPCPVYGSLVFRNRNRVQVIEEEEKTSRTLNLVCGTMIAVSAVGILATKV